MKFKLAIISALLFATTSIYANANHVHQESDYIVSITSPDQARPVKFSGNYMLMGDSGSKMVRLDKVTPFEFHAKAETIAVMLMSMELRGDGVTLEIKRFSNGKEKSTMDGTGSAILAQEDDGKGYIITSPK